MTNKPYSTNNLLNQPQRDEYHGGSRIAFATAVFLLSLIGVGVGLVYCG